MHRPADAGDIAIEAARVTAQPCLLPAGFREGLGMCLFAPDGRHLGFLGLFTSSSAVPSDAARDLLATPGPTPAHAVDPLRTTAAAAQLVPSATAAVILTRAGGVLALPGLPGHPLLAAGSPVLTAAGELLDGPHASFLVPASAEPGGHLTVTVMAVPDHAPRRARAIVVLSPCGDLHGLTCRELEVLGLLIAGKHNAEAAEHLGVTQRTVASHIEHILPKLDAGTRALAAVRAQRRGLYIPPEARAEPCR